MALHKDFPKSPLQILDPSIRWFPADEAMREKEYAKLLPPLVHKLRQEIKNWRDKNYEGVSDTSRALLRWWFQTEHPTETADGMVDFQYYFAQREAIETVIYLYEVAGVKDKYDRMIEEGLTLQKRWGLPEDVGRAVALLAEGNLGYSTGQVIMVDGGLTMGRL